MSKNKHILEQWNQIKKDWYSIYNGWDAVTKKSYSEEIAGLIHREFYKIDLLKDGLRARSFKCESHFGNAETSIPQNSMNADDCSEKLSRSEKLFCRALYNLGTNENLGQIIDYEIPLKERNESDHGDIDLLSTSEGNIFIIEVKHFHSTESILKGLIQVYVYSSLIGGVKSNFYKSFGFDSGSKIVPSLLTFPSAYSGEQLSRINDLPNIKNLIMLFDAELAKINVCPIRFFMVRNNKNEIRNCIEPIAKGKTVKNVKIKFRNTFSLSIKEIQVN
jgi:hypothetical protein